MLETDRESALKEALETIRESYKEHRTEIDTRETKEMLNSKFPEYREFTDSVTEIAEDEQDMDFMRFSYTVKATYHNKDFIIWGFNIRNIEDFDMHMRINEDEDDEEELPIYKNHKINYENVQIALNNIDVPKADFISYLFHLLCCKHILHKDALLGKPGVGTRG